MGRSRAEIGQEGRAIHCQWKQLNGHGEGMLRHAAAGCRSHTRVPVARRVLCVEATEHGSRQRETHLCPAETQKALSKTCSPGGVSSARAARGHLAGNIAERPNELLAMSHVGWMEFGKGFLGNYSYSMVQN